MILPVKDKLIDPDDVRQEIDRQQAAGNDTRLRERSTLGYAGAILFPRRTTTYIKHLQK